MTAIVGMALGHRPIPNQPPVAAHTANFLLNSSGSSSVRHEFHWKRARLRPDPVCLVLYE